MDKVYSYTANASWSGGRMSVGQLQSGGLVSELSVPKTLGGPGAGTNPEELLLSAAAGCYIITLGLLLENRKIQYNRIELTSQGFVEYDGGLRFDRIEHHPTIVVDTRTDEELLKSLAEHAEHACMVSSAIRGNVDVKVFPQILVQETSH